LRLWVWVVQWLIITRSSRRWLEMGYVLASLSEGPTQTFAVRKQQAIADTVRQWQVALKELGKSDTCAVEVARRRIAEAAAGAGGLIAMITFDTDAQLRDCQTRLSQQRANAYLLQMRLFGVLGKLLAARNDTELERAYVDLSPAVLRPILLSRIDAIIDAINTRSMGMTIAQRWFPSLYAPFKQIETQAQQVRTRITAATTSLEIMRLFAAFQTETLKLHAQAMQGLTAAAASGAAGMGGTVAYHLAGELADGVAAAVGDVGSDVAGGVLHMIWNLIKKPLAVLAVAGAGWIVWKKRDVIFKKRLPEATHV
jgi:hypothetical protein